MVYLLPFWFLAMTIAIVPTSLYTMYVEHRYRVGSINSIDYHRKQRAACYSLIAYGMMVVILLYIYVAPQIDEVLTSIVTALIELGLFSHETYTITYSM